MRFSIFTHAEDKKVSIVGIKDEPTARTVFDMDMDLEEAKRMHKELGIALKSFKD